MADLPWFSRDLTQLIHPLIGGRVYVVLAPTGTGKTLFGLNLVASLLQEPESRVMVAATEESPRYLDLLACRAVGVSYADYFYKRLDDFQNADIRRWAALYGANPQLAMVEGREPTLGALVSTVKETGGSPDVFVIDHLHCLGMDGQPLPRFLDLAMSILAQLATHLNTAIVLLAQVHRPTARDPLYPYRIPTVTSGMGSSAIERNADVILGLSRKLRDDTPKDALGRLAKGLLNRGESVRDYEEKNTARVTVLKHRMDDDTCRRSLLLTVNGGKMQDRLQLEGTTNGRGDAYEAD